MEKPLSQGIGGQEKDVADVSLSVATLEWRQLELARVDQLRTLMEFARMLERKRLQQVMIPEMKQATITDGAGVPLPSSIIPGTQVQAEERRKSSLLNLLLQIPGKLAMLERREEALSGCVEPGQRHWIGFRRRDKAGDQASRPISRESALRGAVGDGEPSEIGSAGDSIFVLSIGVAALRPTPDPPRQGNPRPLVHRILVATRVPISRNRTTEIKSALKTNPRLISSKRKPSSRAT
jgi:hypothetical protein